MNSMKKSKNQVYVTFRKVKDFGLRLSAPIAIACEESQADGIALDVSSYAAIRYVYIRHSSKLKKGTILLNTETYRNYLENNAKDIK